MSWFSDFVQQTTGYDPPDVLGDVDYGGTINTEQFGDQAEAARRKAKDLLDEMGSPDPTDVMTDLGNAAGIAPVGQILNDQNFNGIPDDEEGGPADGSGGGGGEGDDPKYGRRDFKDRYGRSDTDVTGGFGERSSRRRTLLG